MISRRLHWRGLAPACLPASIVYIVAGCAARDPAGPTVMVLPAKGEDFAVFQQHDTSCRQYAAEQTGRSPAQAGVARVLTGALVGTGLGAATGALIGSVSGHAGGGTAIGAGAGLLAGSLLGSAHGRSAANATQNRYNIAYTQCMVGNGENIAPPVAPVAYAPAASVVYLPPPLPYPKSSGP